MFTNILTLSFACVAIPGAWKYETMQIILQAQVKTLIDMGVTARLNVSTILTPLIAHVILSWIHR